MINYEVGDLILLNAMNLRLKGVSGKLRKKFIGPLELLNRLAHRVTKLNYLRTVNYIMCFT